jgi:hypothetical protein
VNNSSHRAKQRGENGGSKQQKCCKCLQNSSHEPFLLSSKGSSAASWPRRGLINVRGERAALYRTVAADRGGGERGFRNCEISKALAIFTGRKTSPTAGAKLDGGSTNAPGISAGRAASLQQDIEQGVIPLKPCPQSMGAESSDGAGCCLW